MNIKKYKRKFKEENALAHLLDPTIIDKIIDFIKSTPFPKDREQFHVWAEEQGFNGAAKLEEYVYAIVSVLIVGGKSKGDFSKISDEQLKIGKQIEREHVETGIDNPVIKRIEEIFATKISSDHFIEKDDYYTSTINFRDELEQESLNNEN